MALITHDKDAERIEYGSEDDKPTPSEVLERLQFNGPGVWPPLAGPVNGDPASS